MKSAHVFVAAGAVALVAAFIASRRASTSSAGVRGTAVGYWTPQRQAAYRAQLWSEVPSDFWV